MATTKSMHIMLAAFAATAGASAQAQLQFSAWPLCTNIEHPFGLGSSGTDTGGGIDGFGVFQPVPAKSEDWQLVTICTGVSFNIPGGGELPDEDLPFSGWIVGYLGQPPAVGESPGTPAFFLPVALSPLTTPDTGRTSPSGASIRRVCVSVAPQTIPAGEMLSIALVANLDPTVGIMDIHESDLRLPDATIHDAWSMNFSLGRNVFDGFFNSCEEIAAYELFGPTLVPTVSEWGMAAMSLLLLTAGTLALRTRASPVL